MKPLFVLLLMIWMPACQMIQGSSIGSMNETAVPPSSISSPTTYAITQTITLTNHGPEKPEKHNLWVALIDSQAPYQELISRNIQPANYTLITDEYENQYAEFDFQDLEPGSSTVVKIVYEVAINELAYDLTNCAGDLPDQLNQPELHIESRNPQIIALAKELSAPDQSVCAQVRAFYDYIGDNLVYSYNGEDWGAQAALGRMGADCTEYSSLLIALSRSRGIPARYVEGLLFLDEANAGAAQQEHAWVEVYFPGNGWVPIDPTLGRSSITRAQHFARYTPNHIIVTNGRSPSTLRGASYWSHLYWPGDSADIRVEDAGWTITPQSSLNKT